MTSGADATDPNEAPTVDAREVVTGQHIGRSVVDPGASLTVLGQHLGDIEMRGGELVVHGQVIGDITGTGGSVDVHGMVIGRILCPPEIVIMREGAMQRSR